MLKGKIVKKCWESTVAVALVIGMLGTTQAGARTVLSSEESQDSVGFSRSNSNISGKKSQVARDEEGRQLFKAVHFMVGDKADELTLIDRLRDQPGFDPEVNARFADEAVAAIGAEQPDYFETYADEMTSGNPIRVEREIEDGQRRIADYVEQAHPEAANKDGMTPQACSIGVGGCVWTVALAWNYGAVVNVGAAVVAYTALWGPDKTWSPLSRETQTLERQEAIATLSKEISE